MLNFEEGWSYMEKGITKLIKILEGEPEPQFTPTQYLEIYTYIHKEREGEEIDRELVKSVLDIFVENGIGTLEKYEEDFESFMVQDTASYYFCKVSRWIQEDSCIDYMLKYEECLKEEKERVDHYLHSSTELKLVEAVKEAFDEILKKDGGIEQLK